jgi:hypothetical protein
MQAVICEREVSEVDSRIRRWAAEAFIGLIVALLLVLVAATTVTSVHFVYQGF